MAGRYSSNLKQCNSLISELANALGQKLYPGFSLVEIAERDCDSNTLNKSQMGGTMDEPRTGNRAVKYRGNVN